MNYDISWLYMKLYRLDGLKKKVLTIREVNIVSSIGTLHTTNIFTEKNNPNIS